MQRDPSIRFLLIYRFAVHRIALRPALKDYASEREKKEVNSL
jgi:hypothetical protein